MSGMRKFASFKRFAACLLVVPLLLGNTVMAQSERDRVAIVFDGSASMRGYYKDSIVELNKKLHDVFAGLHLPSDSLIFVSTKDKTTQRDFKSFLEKPKYGSHTRLDDTYKAVADTAVVVLVTDNVQDSGDEDYTSTRNFYHLLENKVLDRVLMVPMALPFDGRLYFDRKRHPPVGQLLADLRSANSESVRFSKDSYNSKRYVTVDMQGDKALAIYIIMTSPLGEDFHDNLNPALVEAFGVQPLVINPVDQGLFSLNGVQHRRRIEEAFSLHDENCRTEFGQHYSPGRPNLMLVPPQISVFGEIPIYTLRALDSVEQRVDESFIYRFYFELRNGTENIVLGKSGCRRDITVTLEDLRYLAHPSYQGMFDVKQPEARLVPAFIPGRVAPIDSAEVESPIVVVESAMPGLQWQFSLGSLFRLAFTESVPVKIQGKLQVTVPRGNFTLSEDYAEQYFTPSALIQSKIYSPEDIVQFVRTEPVVLEYDFQSVNLELIPPDWPAKVVYALITMLLVLLLLVAYSLSLRFVLRFDDTGEELLVYLAVPFSRMAYARSDDPVLQIRKRLLGYELSPATGYSLIKNGEVLGRMTLTRQSSFKIEGDRCETVVECR